MTDWTESPEYKAAVAKCTGACADCGSADVAYHVAQGRLCRRCMFIRCNDKTSPHFGDTRYR